MSVIADQNVSFRVTPESPRSLRMYLKGRLDAQSVANAWPAATQRVAADSPELLQVDVSGLSYCDGAGLGLLAELRRMLSAGGGRLEVVGASEEQARLFGVAQLRDPLAGDLKPPPPAGFVSMVGKSTWEMLQDLGEMISFVGEVTAVLGWAVLHPMRVRYRMMLDVAQKAGANAVPVVGLLGLLVGLILAFQTANPLRRFGAEPLIPTIVAIAVVREMGPLITAVIVAGRSGSAFAAEIGTMKVTEELNALQTMGLDPVRFLVLPRVLAGILVMPMLTAFNILLSVVGAYVVMGSLGYSLAFYVNSVRSAVELGDFLGGLFKALVFGVIVAGIGCLRGMQTQSGPGAVGDSTTRAVVGAIVLTIAADAVLGVVFFYLGI